MTFKSDTSTDDGAAIGTSTRPTLPWGIACPSEPLWVARSTSCLVVGIPFFRPDSNIWRTLYVGDVFEWEGSDFQGSHAIGPS